MMTRRHWHDSILVNKTLNSTTLRWTNNNHIKRRAVSAAHESTGVK